MMGVQEAVDAVVAEDGAAGVWARAWIVGIRHNPAENSSVLTLRMPVSRAIPTPGNGRQALRIQ
jgi:hypothetical protein